jgi:aminoglycoside phosphotransferase (APT) family kinase protein
VNHDLVVEGTAARSLHGRRAAVGLVPGVVHLARPGGLGQPPAHWQCRSRSSTALRIPAGTVAKERRWLPVLAVQLPLPVPEPVALGRPAAGFPWPLSVYRWIEGEPACLGQDRGLSGETQREVEVGLVETRARLSHAPGFVTQLLTGRR